MSANFQVNLRELYRWPDVASVEMCIRVCRQWDVEDDEQLDTKAVRKAEIIVKVRSVSETHKFDI